MLVGLATGAVGAAGITIVHELGHRRSARGRFLSRAPLSPPATATVEHDRVHHMKVATLEHPAGARFGEGWHHPGFPDTFDRWDDDIGGVQWKGSDTALSSSVRR